jgi:hypothetical protein
MPGLTPAPEFVGVAPSSVFTGRLHNPNGNSTYNALQMKMEKRMSNGLTGIVAYAWSKMISDGDIQAGGGPGGQTFYNRRLEKAVADIDVPQALSVSFLYELPFGAGKRFLNYKGVVGKLAGGWEFTAIQQYASATPIVLTATNTLPLFNSTLRPNAVAGVNQEASLSSFNPAVNRYINPAAFSVPAPFTFGTAARSYTGLRRDEAYHSQ